MRKPLRLLALTVWSVAASASAVEAVCACGSSSQCAAVAEASAIFVSRVESHERRGPDTWVARLAVRNVLHGTVAGSSVEVPTRGECDADLRACLPVYVELRPQ